MFAGATLNVGVYRAVKKPSIMQTMHCEPCVFR